MASSQSMQLTAVIEGKILCNEYTITGETVDGGIKLYVTRGSNTQTLYVENGKDYILTDDDKNEIATIVNGYITPAITETVNTANAAAVNADEKASAAQSAADNANAAVDFANEAATNANEVAADIKGKSESGYFNGKDGGLYYPEFDIDASTGTMYVSGLEKGALSFSVDETTGNLEVNID